MILLLVSENKNILIHNNILNSEANDQQIFVNYQ